MKKWLVLLMFVSTFHLSKSQDCGILPLVNYTISQGNTYVFYVTQNNSDFLPVTAIWSVDGVESTTQSLDLVLEFPIPGTYSICATVYYENLLTPEADSCTGNWCQSIDAFCQLEAEFDYTFNPDDSVFTIVANVLNGSGNYSYYFNTWDTQMVSQNGNTYQFTTSSAAATFHITIYDNINNCSLTEYPLVIDNPLLNCVLDVQPILDNNFLSITSTLVNGDFQANYPGVYYDFGDGQMTNLTDGSYPTLHYYSQPGVYTLCAYSVGGYEDSCYDTICVEVQIDSMEMYCNADFIYSVWADGSISLTNYASGYYTDYLWTSSEGNSSSEYNIFQSENFVNDFPVDITLTVSNDFTSCTSSMTQTISMEEQSFTLCGNIFHDINFNYQDDDNAPMAFTSVIIDAPELPEPIVVIAGPDGEFCVELPLLEGYTYSAQIPEGSTGYFYPEEGMISNPMGGAEYAVNIIFYDSTFPTDVELYCETSGFVSAPNGGWYWFSLQNNSAFADHGTITVTVGADETITYWDGISGVLSPDGKVFTFEYFLEPFGIEWYSFGVSLEPTTPLGTIEYLSVEVESESTDIDLTDNICLSHQLVVASYDPNNKLVLPAGEGALGNIPPTTEWLTYTINFQNTGTAPAYIVRLEDEISEFLDPESIEMLASSHVCTTEIQDHLVTWTFNEIMLPDSFTNEPESHGFVMFRIRINENLPDQTAIENTAAIYFDFNEPVITNTALNTIDYAINATNELGEKIAALYPNPASEQFILDAKAVGYLRVMDMEGRCIHTSKTNIGINEIDCHNWASGLYHLVFQSENTSASLRLIKN